MKTREEIFKELQDAYGNHETIMKLSLEVLIDIRDMVKDLLLESKK